MSVVEPAWLAAHALQPELAWAGKAWARHMARAGTWYDEAAAEAAAEFFPTYLRHTEGEWAGRPFVLSPWQAAVVRITFGLKRPDGSRLLRRVIIWVARKNGKTEFLAGLSILALVCDGEFGGQGYAIAADKNQAGIVFGKAVSMVQMSGPLAEHLQTYRTSIFCPELNASFKPLSGTPHGKHGFSASFVAGDEIHEWPNGDLYTFVHQSTAARRQPLEVLISTAGQKSRNHGWPMWEESLKIVDGTLDDPETLVVIYAAEPEDDWTDEAVWRKANPNIGISPKLEYLRAECEKARFNPRLENDFRRYHLNQWTEQAVRWLPLDLWDACVDPEIWHVGVGRLVQAEIWTAEKEARLVASLRGRRAFGGLDLSSTSDVTALVWAFPPVADDPMWRVLCRFWIPADSIRRRTDRDRVPYDLWARRGAVLSTEGNVVDYRAIKAQIYADAELFPVASIAVDRWNATQIVVEMQEEGLPVTMFGQGYASMSAPAKELERLTFGGLVDHGAHPVLRWMAANVAITSDPAGNIKPAKDKSSEKIDGIVAEIMALGVAMAGAEEPANIDDFLANAVVV